MQSPLRVSKSVKPKKTYVGEKKGTNCTKNKLLLFFKIVQLEKIQTLYETENHFLNSQPADIHRSVNVGGFLRVSLTPVRSCSFPPQQCRLECVQCL